METGLYAATNMSTYPHPFFKEKRKKKKKKKETLGTRGGLFFWRGED